jgi:hypothetical protein
MVRFFTVQSATDAARLAAGGSPWPTGLQRANLGIGLYAWDFLETAEGTGNACKATGLRAWKFGPTKSPRTTSAG